MPATARRSSWPPGCWRPGSGRPCTLCTGSPGPPTISSTSSTGRGPQQRAEQLGALSTRLFGALVGSGPRRSGAGRGRAYRRKYDIGWDLFDAFLESMRMDLTVTDYPHRVGAGPLHVRLGGGDRPATAADTGHRRSARAGRAVCGGARARRFSSPTSCATSTRICAADGCYLPADELAAHGVDRDLLTWCQTNRRTDPRVRAALAEQHAITRGVYDQARPGVGQLHPSSRPCVAAALTLYSEILARIEELDFEVFRERATVGKPRRLAVALGGIGRVWASRMRHGSI